ncbi:hypothetical protein [Variovorax sp. RO1]|uniref:hypothetical protein n=1 Tax=Variovorax sp. RO1 TaxID=2066034 RepID=UPI00117FE7A7|nr:hypothetical protein [Variovorax sp. RO1]
MSARRFAEAEVAARFPQDVAQHEMTILRDDGVDRHLRFKRPGSSIYWFDVITWGGRLYIGGDCGTYVFARIEDMFEFFRGHEINPQYWAEKVQAADKNSGIEAFSDEVLKETLKHYVENHAESEEWSDKQRDALWAAVEQEVFGYDTDEHTLWRSAEAFEQDGFRFRDLWDYGRQTAYEYHYLWSITAVVWAIGKYDAHKDAVNAAAAGVAA